MTEKHATHCDECGTPIQANRPNHRLCSNKCASARYRRKMKLKKATELTALQRIEQTVASLAAELAALRTTNQNQNTGDTTQ